MAAYVALTSGPGLLRILLFTFPLSMVGVIGYGGVGFGLDRMFASIVILQGALLWIWKKRSINLQVLLVFIVAFFIVAPPLILNKEIVTYFIDRTQASGIGSSAAASLNQGSIIKIAQLVFSAFFALFLAKRLSQLGSTNVERFLTYGLIVVCGSAFLDFIPGIESLYQVIKQNPSYPVIISRTESSFGFDRLSGLTAEPSHLVVFAAAGLILMAGRYFFSPVIFGRSQWVATSVFGSTAILSLSPSLLAMLAPITVAILFYSKKTTRRALMIVVAILAIAALYISGWFQLIGKAYMLKLGLGAPAEVGYSELRALSFKYSLEVGMDNNWFGVGLGNFGLTVGLPNLLFASTGIIGVVLSVILVIRYVFACKRVSKTYVGVQRHLWISFFGIALGVLTMSLFTKGLQVLIHIPYIIFLVLPLINGAPNPVSSVRRLRD